jgi:DNA-directed RNA polymerase specialized sigma24 family protein
MNHEEIAAATGLRALSIKILLFRARRRAAALLEPPGWDSQKRFV